jgi:hypothetical protein
MTSDLMECLCEAGQKFMAGLLELGSVSKVKAVGYLVLWRVDIGPCFSPNSINYE